MPTSIQQERRKVLRKVIGPAVPRLWCPPITHYTAAGAIDKTRTEAHWRTMVQHVGGFLVPGSTGDAWEMTEDELHQSLLTATELARRLDTYLLIGALRADVKTTIDVIAATLETLEEKAGTQDVAEAMRHARVVGFTVCPPQGANLGQAEIQADLETVLDLGLPTAIYQLPQVTQNEIAPETFRQLAARYANLLILKDTSGTDRVPQADDGSSGVFLVRGAEGDYAPWLKEAGGCYHGLLLSSANGFAAELATMIALLESGEVAAAQALSARIAAAVRDAFDAVDGLPDGNAFANANKAIDHVRAYGHRAHHVAPPRLHAGTRLPRALIDRVIQILDTYGFLPEIGYLQEPSREATA